MMLSQNLRDVVPRKAPRGGFFGTFVVLASFFEPVLAAFFAPWPSPLLVESLVGPSWGSLGACLVPQPIFDPKK